MISRLLAFVLAFVISSPTCWCCVPREATQAKTEAPSCCHESAPAPTTDKPAKRNPCPCAFSLTKRDLADGKIPVPKLLATGDLVPMLVTHVLSTPVAVRAALAHVDEDPPWRSQKLYLRHCSQLL